MPNFKIKKFGWKKDFPDFRDFKYKPKILKVSLPEKVDLRPNCPPVLDQNMLGSCTSQCTANLLHFCELKDSNPRTISPSRLFIYYNTRKIEGTTSEDSGAYLRDCMKAVHKYGVCNEILWPYIIKKFTIKPPKKAYNDAIKHKITKYMRINQTSNDLRYRLYEGYPVVFGFMVYESFESDETASTGIVNLPNKDESPLGGHAVLLVGYDDSKKLYIVQNSWGTGWGDKGYFYMPYDYIHNNELSDDFWSATVVP